MLPIILLSVPIFGLLAFGHVLQGGLIGAGVGAVGARIAIGRWEKSRGELPGWRVRQIELNWTCACAFVGIAVSMFV